MNNAENYVGDMIFVNTFFESVKKLPHVNNHKAYNLFLFCKEIENGSS